jgi:hypothetical protein
VYTLLDVDGPYLSETPGRLGGNSKDKIYGQLDCWSASRWVGRGYERIRVFFARRGDCDLGRLPAVRQLHEGQVPRMEKRPAPHAVDPLAFEERAAVAR